MPNKHKSNPVCFRPPEAERDWLYQEAAATGSSVGAVLTQLIRERRAAEAERDAQPPGNPAATQLAEAGRAAGRRRGGGPGD